MVWPTEPRVVSLRDPSTRERVEKGDPTLVIVDRTSEWGNPFVMTDPSQRQDVIEKFRVHVYTQWLFEKQERLHLLLRGKDLACWCAPKACHADLLLELANGLFCADHGIFEPTCDYCGLGQCETPERMWDGRQGCHVACLRQAGRRG
jgi:hypothetical protein